MSEYLGLFGAVLVVASFVWRYILNLKMQIHKLTWALEDERRRRWPKRRFE